MPGPEPLVRPAVYLVSSCLVGLVSRYDGTTNPSDACRRELADKIWIPVCPEQLGGLPTPRTSADLVDGQGDGVLAGTARVVNRDGVEVTEQFLCGARQVLEIAEAGLKARARAATFDHDETHFLSVLKETVASGRTAADELLEHYHGDWNGDLDRIYAEYSY